MKNNNIFLWVGLIILALVLIFVAKNNGPTGDNFVKSVLISEETFWDFKTISMADGNVSHDFVLKNNGREPIKITKIQTSCMCTNANLLTNDGKVKGPFGMHESPPVNLEIMPNESVKLQAIFDPNAHGPAGVGIMDRSIYIDTNSSEKPRLELKFVANVIK